MSTIWMLFNAVCFIVTCVLAFLLGRIRRELADMADDRDMQANEKDRFKSLHLDAVGRALTAEHRFGEIKQLLALADADADRLYPIAKEHLETIDLIETKLPPNAERLDVSKEREAIRLHEEAVKLRTK